MRADARIPHLDGVAVTSTEGPSWLVELMADATVRVTLDRGVTVGAIAHGGQGVPVRARLAIDADAGDRPALDAAVAALVQAAPLERGMR